jgi:hypothetical protein
VCDLFAQGLDVGAGAVHEHDEVVGLCRMPCYAAWAGEALSPLGFEPVRAA